MESHHCSSDFCYPVRPFCVDASLCGFCRCGERVKSLCVSVRRTVRALCELRSILGTVPSCGGLAFYISRAALEFLCRDRFLQTK